MLWVYREAAALCKIFQKPTTEGWDWGRARVEQQREEFTLCSSALPLEKRDKIWYAKDSVAFSQRPRGCCLLLAVLGEVQGVLNNSVLFQQHLQQHQPLQSADWGSFGREFLQRWGGATGWEGAARWMPSHCPGWALLLRVLAASDGKFQTEDEDLKVFNFSFIFLFWMACVKCCLLS